MIQTVDDGLTMKTYIQVERRPPASCLTSSRLVWIHLTPRIYNDTACSSGLTSPSWTVLNNNNICAKFITSTRRFTRESLLRRIWRARDSNFTLISRNARVNIVISARVGAIRDPYGASTIIMRFKLFIIVSGLDSESRKRETEVEFIIFVFTNISFSKINSFLFQKTITSCNYYKHSLCNVCTFIKLIFNKKVNLNFGICFFIFGKSSTFLRFCFQKCFNFLFNV